MSPTQTLRAETLRSVNYGTAGRFERQIERWSDRLNPILVKEARQALKSKQFTITFSLLLVCAWGWSILGVFAYMPDIYYAPTGLPMLLGYYFILAIPLLLVVPYSTFRSMAAEREDLTYELLSISTLSSRQIVTGKLGTAFLQMLVYFSALAPCIAFTYLLRGVDIVFVLLLLAYTFCMSMLLCCLGLVFAGLARSRQWQTLISVILLLCLIGIGLIWGMSIGGIAIAGGAGIPFDEPDFWIAQLAVLTAVSTYAALLILVAAAQNSFASDNRSTSIRIAMFVQSVLFVGWVSYGWIRRADDELLVFAMIAALIHWYVYGTLLTGESPVLSPRVRRELPVTFFGRAFLTWFNPGSGTGYIFAICHVLVLLGMIIVASVVYRDFSMPTSRFANIDHLEHLVLGCVLSAGYFVAYLGLSRLVVVLFRIRDHYGLLLPVLINALILLIGSAAPFLIASWRHRFTFFDYSVSQATNWMWTIAESFESGFVDPRVIVLVLLGALVILCINLVLIRREVESTRIETPERVKRDDEVIGHQETLAIVGDHDSQSGMHQL